MTFFNARPYTTLPHDLFEQFIEGQRLASGLKSTRAQNESIEAENRYKANMFNEMLQQQMQQQQPMYQQGPMYQQEPMQSYQGMDRQQPMLMQGRNISADQAQDMLSSVMAQQGQLMPMQQPMPMQRQQSMPMQPNPQYIQRKLIQNQLLGLAAPKEQVIDGQNYMIFPDGEFIPVGPAAPTERQKEFSKKDAEKYNKLQDEYSGLLETQSVIEGLTQLAENPLLDRYLSSSTSYPLRAAANFYNRSTGKDDRAEYIAQLSDLGNRLVNAASKDFKGSFTNQELNFLISQKPNANDTPIQLRTKVANLQKFMQEKMGKTEYALDRMQEGKSYREAMKEYMSQNKPSLNNNKNSEIASQEPVDESTLIAQAMQGEGPQGGNAPRQSATSGMSLSDILNAISGQMAGGVPLAPIAAPARGAAQSAYDAAKSVGNLVPEAVEYTTGYNMGRIPELQITNPDAQGVEGLLQNLGYYGAPLAANVSALPMAAGAIGKAAQAANLGPKAAALAQALGMAGAGAAEGFALGEGNRGLGAFLGGLTGAIPGAIQAGRGYAQELSSAGIGKNIAKNVKSAERALGSEIGNALKTAEEAGAKIKMATGNIEKDKMFKALKSRFKNESGAIEAFIKNPTLENAHWAQSAIGDMERNLAQPSKKAYGNRTNQQLMDYAKELSNKIRANMSQAFADAKVDPSLYESARKNYADFVSLSKSKPMQSFKKAGNALDSDYAKLADSVLKDKGLTERAIPYGRGLSDRATIDALAKFISQYGGAAALGATGLGGLSYGVNQLTKGD